MKAHYICSTYATSHKYITIYKQTTNIQEHKVVYTTDEDKDRERKKTASKNTSPLRLRITDETE